MGCFWFKLLVKRRNVNTVTSTRQLNVATDCVKIKSGLLVLKLLWPSRSLQIQKRRTSTPYLCEL